MSADSRMPNLYILGAPKCGTTALYRYLGQHPDVYFPVNKEPQFFCNEGLFRRGIGFYLDRFYDGAAGHAIRGDATPHYLYYEKVAERLAGSAPEDARYLVILRDPVARAWSHYWNTVQEGFEPLGFPEALEREQERVRDAGLERLGTLRYHYMAAGRYAEQLERYFRHLDPQRFLVLFHDDLVRDPLQTMARVTDVLGLEPFGFQVNARHNPAGTARSARLQRLVREPPALLRALGSRLPYALKYRAVTALLRANKKVARYPSLDASLAAELRRRFRDDVAALETMTGRDLRLWRQEQARGPS